MDFRLLISYELELDEPVETEKHSDLRHFLQGPREEEEKHTQQNFKGPRGGGWSGKIQTHRSGGNGEKQGERKWWEGDVRKREKLMGRRYEGEGRGAKGRGGDGWRGGEQRSNAIATLFLHPAIIMRDFRRVFNTVVC